MTDLQTAALQALEALQNCANGEDDVLLTRGALAALRAALAEDALQRFTDVNQEIEVALAEPEPPIGKASTDVGVPVYVVKKAEPVPPAEAQTEAEKIAYCAGWWAALEKARKAEMVQGRKPLTVMELQDALVYTNLIDPDAVNDPEGYDEGSTLAQIDALHGLLTGDDHPCNPHPKAPHGFSRNASHTEDRYVCECEGWEPYEAGYQAGMEAALRAQS
jgi:hypothetical protein